MADPYCSEKNQRQQQSEPPNQSDRTDASSTNLVTPAEYIYNSMTHLLSEMVELSSLARRNRRSMGDGGEGGGPITSMDLFLRSDDFELDGSRLQSSDFVKNLLNAEKTHTATDDAPSSEKERKIVSLTQKLERIRSAGDEIVPLQLNESFRISSGDWIGDYKAESVDLGPMDPSLFASSSPFDGAGTSWHKDYQIPLSPEHELLQMPPLPNPDATDTHATATSNAVNIKAATLRKTPTTGKRKKKRRKQRVLDESRVIEPTDNDILFGRGGFTNDHPGNIRFRKKALEMRSWYEKSTKDEKQRIADLLVESVKSEGSRFVEKGKDGLWHEVIYGEHTKASQALRERLKGDRKK